jgi:hypothetical protein
MKIHPVKNQTLNVTAETMDIGMTGIDYLGAKEVQFIEVSATDPEFGATFRVICNGKEMEASEHFFVPTK